SLHVRDRVLAIWLADCHQDEATDPSDEALPETDRRPRDDAARRAARGDMDRSTKGVASVVVHDVMGPIYEVLRAAGDEMRVRRVDDGVHELSSSGADLIVLAAYERTDWRAARRLQSEVPTVIVSARYDHRR